MKKKQLAALFVCALVIWTVGNGLLPLLPVYAILLRADPASIGYYLSFSYLALATGTLTAGWISDRFQHRKNLLVVAGVVAVPITWLMSRVTSIWGLTLTTASLWFLGGLGLAMTSILTGLSVEKSERGKIFGILAFTSGLGALIGGLTTGPIADLWGYPTLFVILTPIIAIWPLSGLFLENETVSIAQPKPAATRTGSTRYALGLIILLVANLAAEVAFFLGRLGTSLEMHQLGFVSAAISGTAAIGGAVTLPLPPLLGSLSDRISRKILLGICYLAALSGLLVLAIASQLWQFLVAASLLAFFAYTGAGVGSALITDLVDSKSLGRAISMFSSTGWIGGIIGFASTGLIFSNFGAIPTFILGAVLPAVGMSFLVIAPIPGRKLRPIVQSDRNC